MFILLYKSSSNSLDIDVELEDDDVEDDEVEE